MGASLGEHTVFNLMVYSRAVAAMTRKHRGGMKKKKICGIALLLAVGCVSVMLTGCPRTTQLEVSPASIVFSEDQTDRRLTLSNLGSRSLEWTLETVVRESEEAAWTAGDIPWLNISKTSGVLLPGVEHIALTADRSGQMPGTYSNVAVRVLARNFEAVVPISLVVSPQLFATPDIITLQAGGTSAQFRLENRGQIAVNWSAQYFEGNDPSVEATALPSDMTLTPNGGALARQSSVTVQVNWTQERTDFGLRISIPESPGNDAVVLFRFGVPITDLVVEPTVLSLFYSRTLQQEEVSSGDQPASTLTLRNAGRRTLQWSITVRTRGEAIDQEIAPILVETVSGTLPPGESEAVLVRVADPETAIPGGGNYEIEIAVVDQEGVLIVPLVLESIALPVVIASDPPDENSISYTLKRTLDFGRTDTQLEFWVVNIGPLESRLNFQIRHEDEGLENPLIADVAPMFGDTNGPEGVFAVGEGRFVDAQRVVVTVDRTAMTEDVEYRDLFIEAWDEDGEARIDAVQPWQIQIRVERPPMTIEGAINRSRPPYLLRFIFMLRDTLGQVIPTQTAEDLAKINFVISENESPVDMNEVTMEMKGPEDLKVNMVLMLDYTGSMYYAGVGDEAFPRQPGDVLEEVKEAAAMFIDDLPPSYRVALMYHNDRQPLNRLIHPFSTNRESLKNALRLFTVPAQMHGTSDIWDALVDATDRIVAEDATDTLPYDDADIRAVLFITDGNDNSSTVASSAASSAAKDQRVRLYPLAYSAGVGINYPNLIPLAEETGGHFYNAGTADKLVNLLGHKRSLVLKPVAYDPTSGVAEFKIFNAGQGPLTWSILEEEVNPWLTSISPANGVTPPGAESLISVTVDPLLVTGVGEAGRSALQIQSSDGNGEVQVYLALESGTTTIQSLSLSMRDEPGLVWGEMQNQVVLSYVTPTQGSGSYSIRANYTQVDGGTISSVFEENGIYYPGDVRAGQISMNSTGISYDYAAATWEEVAQAEIYVRADYVPRFVNIFRMRFMPMTANTIPANVQAAFWEHTMKVELAPEGLLVFDAADITPNWRLVPENDGIYRMLTPKDYALPYGANGNLLRITFSNLWPFVEAADAAGIEPEFFLDMRVDNTMYYAPATDVRPSETVYFLYPSGPTNPDRPLRVSEEADLAGPSRTVEALAFPGIDAEATGAWDRDEDGLLDFSDPFPDEDSTPGRLTRPPVIRFVPGTQAVSVTVINNRLDRFNWSADVITPAGSSLVADQFSWSVLDSDSNWVPLGAGEVPAGLLAPGETENLLLHFDPRSLPVGTYPAQLLLDTDVFGLESTPIEAQP